MAILVLVFMFLFSFATTDLSAKEELEDTLNILKAKLLQMTVELEGGGVKVKKPEVVKIGGEGKVSLDSIEFFCETILSNVITKRIPKIYSCENRLSEKQKIINDLVQSLQKAWEKIPMEKKPGDVDIKKDLGKNFDTRNSPKTIGDKFFANINELRKKLREYIKKQGEKAVKIKKEVEGVGVKEIAEERLKQHEERLKKQREEEERLDLEEKGRAEKKIKELEEKREKREKEIEARQKKFTEDKIEVRDVINKYPANAVPILNDNIKRVFLPLQEYAKSLDILKETTLKKLEEIKKFEGKALYKKEVLKAYTLLGELVPPEEYSEEYKEIASELSYYGNANVGKLLKKNLISQDDLKNLDLKLKGFINKALELVSKDDFYFQNQEMIDAFDLFSSELIHYKGNMLDFLTCCNSITFRLDVPTMESLRDVVTALQQQLVSNKDILKYVGQAVEDFFDEILPAFSISLFYSVPSNEEVSITTHPPKKKMLQKWQVDYKKEIVTPFLEAYKIVYQEKPEIVKLQESLLMLFCDNASKRDSATAKEAKEFVGGFKEIIEKNKDAVLSCLRSTTSFFDFFMLAASSLLYSSSPDIDDFKTILNDINIVFGEIYNHKSTVPDDIGMIEKFTITGKLKKFWKTVEEKDKPMDPYPFEDFYIHIDDCYKDFCGNFKTEKINLMMPTSFVFYSIMRNLLRVFTYKNFEKIIGKKLWVREKDLFWRSLIQINHMRRKLNINDFTFKYIHDQNLIDKEPLILENKFLSASPEQFEKLINFVSIQIQDQNKTVDDKNIINEVPTMFGACPQVKNLKGALIRFDKAGEIIFNKFITNFILNGIGQDYTTYLNAVVLDIATQASLLKDNPIFDEVENEKIKVQNLLDAIGFIEKKLVLVDLDLKNMKDELILQKDVFDGKQDKKLLDNFQNLKNFKIRKISLQNTILLKSSQVKIEGLSNFQKSILKKDLKNFKNKANKCEKEIEKLEPEKKEPVSLMEQVD